MKKVCDGDKYRKTGISKKDGCSYKFEYTDNDKIPDNYVVKKSNDLRKKLTDEDKKLRRKEWRNKEYKCSKCGNKMKNGNRQYHNKTHI